jgi:hypothetical protein
MREAPDPGARVAVRIALSHGQACAKYFGPVSRPDADRVALAPRSLMNRSSGDSTLAQPTVHRRFG